MAINFVNSLSTSMIALVAVGGAFTCLVQSLKIISGDESESENAKKNIKTTLKGVAIGLSITGLIKFIFSLLGGGGTWI